MSKSNIADVKNKKVKAKVHPQKIPNATQEVMRAWYKNGPDYTTSKDISGKNVVKHLIIQGNFRLQWSKYVKSISKNVWIKLGYKFPCTIPAVPDAQGHMRHTNESVLEFFDDPEAAYISRLMQGQNKAKTRTTLFNDEYLANMKRWYHEGYIDPKTNTRITGKDIIQQGITTDTFAKTFISYVKSLDPSTKEAIGFAIRNSLSTNFRLMGVKKGDMKIETFLKTIGETDINSVLLQITKQHRRINISPAEYLAKIQNWYTHGYLTDSGKIITGKEIILDCVKENGGYIENFRKYVNSISPTEEKSIGVRFHTSFTGIFRFLGKNPKSSLFDFLKMVGETHPKGITKKLKKPLRINRTKKN